MREYSTPLSGSVVATGPLSDDVIQNAAQAADTVQFSRPDGAGGWTDVTCAEFHQDVVAVAKGLMASGVGAGDRVALISRTRYEWTLFDYAIWFAGAVTVPIYESSSAEQIRWILSDSGARAVLVEDADHRARVDTATSDRPGLPDLDHVWSLDGGAVDGLREAGAAVGDDDLEARRAAVTGADLATLIYTSGTTGRPKGCRLTHDNFQAELGVAISELEDLFDSDGASTLLFLPLAHVFARIIQVGCVKARTRMGHSADVAHLVPQLASFQPTFVLAVPRVFEKVFNTASQRATADGKGAIFDRAVEAAITYSRALDTGRVPLRVRAQQAVFSRLVHQRLRDALGGRCEFAISGGAPLGERLGHFYRGIGITVLEGYGLTETTAALTVNLPGAQKVGTVGRPLPGTAVRVADDGELMVTGGQVFAGYWDNDEASQEAIDDDAWFHTGDVGEVDDEGFVRITGRKKEIIVTAGGKNVAPAVLEDLVRASPLVSQCLVVGDGQPFISALITLDDESVAAWAVAQGKTPQGKSPRMRDLVDDADLIAAIQAAVDDANRAVSKAESIRKFALLPHDWTEEAGHVTPSLKLKRMVVMRDFREDIAALYR